MSYNDQREQEPRQKSVLVPVLLMGVAAFSVGVLGTAGFAAWTNQQNKMAAMSQQLEDLMSAPQAAQQVAQADQEVTRTESLSLLDLPKAPAAMAEPVAAPEPAPKSVANQLQDLVALAALDKAADLSVDASVKNKTLITVAHGVDDLAQAVVRRDYVFTNRGSRNGKLRILFDTHIELQARIETLLSIAAADGSIAINPALRGSDGSYDGAIILMDLVQRRLLNGNDTEQSAGFDLQAEALALMNPDRLASIVAKRKNEDQYYVVQPGDSLAYLALQFFGDTSDYQRIFAANRDVLSTPDRIRIGQRLRIPKV